MGRTRLPVPMSALSFKMVRRMHIASTLIAGGVRPVNVAAATRLDRKYLSNMWREVQGFPARGQTPLYAHSMLKCNRDAKHAAVFVAVLRKYAEPGDLQDPAFFLYCYRIFSQITTIKRLSMEQSFYVWRDFQKGYLRMQHCTRCKGQYLYSDHHDAPDTLRNCQICKTRNPRGGVHTAKQTGALEKPLGKEGLVQ